MAKTPFKCNDGDINVNKLSNLMIDAFTQLITVVSLLVVFLEGFTSMTLDTIYGKW